MIVNSQFLTKHFCFIGSEGGSEQTRPLKSSSQEPSEPRTPDFDPVSDKRLPPPAQFETTKDYVIQIDEPESPSKALFITKEEDNNLQKPITPKSQRPETSKEQILSATALESQFKETALPVSRSLTPAPEAKVSTVSETPKRDSREKTKSTLSSPRSARVSPSPHASPTPSIPTDKGKSKVTGKVVSGWL